MLNQKNKFSGTIGFGDFFLEFNFVISKNLYYMQYHSMLLEQCGHMVA